MSGAAAAEAAEGTELEALAAMFVGGMGDKSWRVRLCGVAKTEATLTALVRRPILTACFRFGE